MAGGPYRSINVIRSRAVHAAVAFLLDALPEQVHLVIAARAEPALPVARLRGRGDDMIRVDDVPGLCPDRRKQRVAFAGHTQAARVEVGVLALVLSTSTSA